MRPHHPIRAVAAALCTAALLVTAAAPAAADLPPPTYRPPVDAPVIDPFRPPATPYGPGNRGLEYDTEPGQIVRAAAGGQVTFAGSVAGTLAVTVLHPDGLRTSVTYLATIEVHLGQRVEQGDRLGTAGDRLHFGARVGDAYLDPAALFGNGAARVHLIAFEDPPGVGPAGERRAILGFLGRGLRLADDTVRWLAESSGERASLAVHYAVELQMLPHAVRLAAAVATDLATERPCTAAGSAPPQPPPGRRVAVLVGGLGSSSIDAAVDTVDTGALGVARADVIRFSYAGGRIPDRSDALRSIAATGYQPIDTQADLHRSAAVLADLLEATARAAPGAGIEVVAHSQGGLVLRLALAEMQRRGTLAAVPIDLAVTIGTPHHGADLATAVAAANDGPATRALLGAAGRVLPLGLDPASPSVAQLAETSSVIDELAATPLPAGLRWLSIGGRGDLIVPGPRTALPGATNVIVAASGPTAHDRLPAEVSVTREIALAAAGLPPTCESRVDRALDAVTGDLIGWGEDHLGAAALAAGGGGP